MAAKPPKPPDNNITQKPLSKRDSNFIKRNEFPFHQHPADQHERKSPQESRQEQKANCSCTNIGIMQLFHEMKQKFPTVPDQVVNQCVIDNCHDREMCIQTLNKELAEHPNTSQAYPSHALRASQLADRKLLVPTRPAPSPIRTPPPRPPPPVIIEQQSPSQHFFDVDQREGSLDRIGRELIISDKTPQITNCDTKSSLPPQRPITLSFFELIDSNSIHASSLSPRVVRRPVRVAPPPPSRHHTPTLDPSKTMNSIINSPQNQNKNVSSTSIQSPISYSDSGESEISVNISLSSPSSERPRSRHLSTISMQPDPPYTRDFTLQSPRSFTSLNLTLRPPSSTPQLPIDITAGPGLTYSSSSFDARRGYQKKFHITVSDEGGTISASRIRPKSCYNIPPEHPESEFFDQSGSEGLKAGSSLPNVGQNLVKRRSEEELQEKKVDRQKIFKLKLHSALQSDKKRLRRIKREIKILSSTIPPGEAIRLDDEILRLRCDCERMVQEIERAGELENADFYQNICTGQRLPIQNVEERRVLRPAPIIPSLNSPLHYHQRQRQLENSRSGDDNDDTNSDVDLSWTCNLCTFLNHPLLNKCEACEMVRITPGTVQLISSSYRPAGSTSAALLNNALPNRSNSYDSATASGSSSSNNTNINNQGDENQLNNSLEQLSLKPNSQNFFVGISNM